MSLNKQEFRDCLKKFGKSEKALCEIMDAWDIEIGLMEFKDPTQKLLTFLLLNS